MSKQYYGGWLRANKDEYNELVELGVFGPMLYAPVDNEDDITRAIGKDGSISYCYCDYETLLKLQDRYEEIWRTKYPHYSPGDIYPNFSEISEEEIKQLKDVHYHWNNKT